MPFFQKIKNEFVDVGQNIKNAFAPNSKPKAEAKVLSDGSVTHNVDLSEYKGGERAKAEQLIEKTAQAIHTYESKAAEARANGDGELAKHYDAKKLETEEAFTQLKWELEHRDLDVWHALALVGGLGVVLARAPDLQDRIVEGEEVVAHLVDVDAAGATRVGEGAGADGTGKPEGAFGALGGKSPEELAAWFESDPQGFFDALNELGSEERGAILMMVQGQIQQTNQLFSMLTNFQSAMHDTQKAMISNLRV